MNPARLRLVESTPTGRGAVRVLALLGAGARARIEQVFQRRIPLPGHMALVRLALHATAGVNGAEGGSMLDEALVLVRAEDEVELHLHGSPFVVSRVAKALGLEPGAALRPEARVAPGWVTRRSSLGPAPLLELGAARLLLQCQSEMAARVLLDQSEGALGRALEDLLEALGRKESSRVRAGLDRLLQRWALTRALLHPPRVVLAGPANAGKSTLFNLMVGEERVLVAPSEGTTRDAIRVRAPMGAWVIEWIDTAGERELKGFGGAAAVEAAGQELARRLFLEADLVLWLARDPRAHVPTGATGLVSCARGALLRRPDARARISVRERPREARACVDQLVRGQLELPTDSWRPGAPSPFRVEQAELIRRARTAQNDSQRKDLLERLLAGAGVEDSPETRAARKAERKSLS